MSRHLILILTAFALAACQFSGDNSKSKEIPPPRSGQKSSDNSGEGRLFAYIFRKKPPKSILLPPDLVSSAGDAAQKNHEQAQTLLGQQVLPDVTGARIVTQDGRRWLRVESDAQAVWDKLVEFWAGLQIDLVESQPTAGLMETDWIDINAPEEEEGVSIARLFGRLTGAGAAYDKYLVRLERELNEVTRVFVSHRSTERKEIQLSSTYRDTRWEWVSGENDEKSARLLQTLVLMFRGREDST